MRRSKLLLIGAIMTIVTACATVPVAGSASADVSIDFFYSTLSPHGAWMVSADYGRVWQPAVYASGWNPYYDGHWVYTDLGWTWVSDYEWGAIPYHYGTWVVDEELGWIWVPGTTWAPAWVVFRTGPDYIGWAPVSPGFTLGLSIRSYEPPPEQFVFVSAGSFLSPRIRTAVVRDRRRGEIINRTQIINNLTVVNNVVVNRGPDVGSVERAGGRPVREVRIEDVARAAPGARVDREQLRVSSRGAGTLRATEPVPRMERQPSARDPEPRTAEPRQNLRPHEPGPPRGSGASAPRPSPDDDKAKKPPENKKPRRPDQKPKKERQRKPDQPQGNDGQKPE